MMEKKSAILPPDWAPYLDPIFLEPEMKKLRLFLKREKELKKKIYPPNPLVFNAFFQTPWDKVQVVLLGQDPYHGPGQAEGLSFSVPKGCAIPPSLRNIFKELAHDQNIQPPSHGHLLSWAQQGVLLLNAVLTVEEGKPGSHQNQGWEYFTDKVIDILNEKKRGLIFVLWGNYALKKRPRIDETKHHVLTSVHPSPLSAHRGFFGSRPFSQINHYLSQHHKTPLDWKLL